MSAASQANPTIQIVLGNSSQNTPSIIQGQLKYSLTLKKYWPALKIESVRLASHSKILSQIEELEKMQNFG